MTIKASIKWLLLVFIIVLPVQSASINDVISNKEISSARKQYGELAARRLEALQQLIKDNITRPERLKINMVNDFFSNVTFMSDKEVWKRPDFWATPAELLAKDKGDAEDFAIAKYFTLKALGVDERKIFFSYVTATRIKKSHMVLTYFKNSSSEPLILDSLTDRVLKASARSDLIPIYSFRAQDLTSSSQNSSKEGFKNSINQWGRMQRRMKQGIVK